MDSCDTDCPNYSLGPHAGKGRIRVATPLYCTVQSVGDAHPTRHGRPWHLQGPAGCVGWESKTALPEWRGKRVAPRAHTNLSCKGLMLSAFETVQVYFSSGLYGKLPCNGEAAQRERRCATRRGGKKGVTVECPRPHSGRLPTRTAAPLGGVGPDPRRTAQPH